MATVAHEQTYTYVRPPELTFVDGRADLMLATSGGRTAHGPATRPVFFDGFLGSPDSTGFGSRGYALVPTSEGSLTLAIAIGDPPYAAILRKARYR